MKGYVRESWLMLFWMKGELGDRTMCKYKRYILHPSQDGQKGDGKEERDGESFALLPRRSKYPPLPGLSIY